MQPTCTQGLQTSAGAAVKTLVLSGHVPVLKPCACTETFCPWGGGEVINYALLNSTIDAMLKNSKCGVFLSCLEFAIVNSL